MDISILIPPPLKDFFSSDSWLYAVFIAKIVSAAMSVLLIAGIAYLTVKTNLIGNRIENYAEAISRKALIVPKKKIIKQWEKIKKMSESDYDADYKLALLDADKIFDEVMKLVGFFGKDMAERMKGINAGQLSNVEDVWWAHKLRNSMVHDSRFKLTRGDVAKAVEIFEKALKELEALD